VQVAVLCLLGSSFVVNPVLYAVHRGFERFHWVNLMLVLAAAGNLTVLLALAFVQHLTPFAYAVGCLGVQWALVAMNVWRLGEGVMGVHVERATYAHLVRDGFRFFLPLSLIGLFVVADRAILISAGTMEEMGHYVVAFSVAAPIGMVTEVFAQVGFVEMARSGDAEISSALAVRRIRVAQMSSALAALLVLAIAPTIVAVAFGREYIAATSAAQILIVAVSLRGLSKVMEHFLRAKSLASPGIVYGVVSLAWLMVLGLILSPVHGSAGLALSLLAAEAMGLATLVVSFRKTFGVPVRSLWGIRPSVFREVWAAARVLLGAGRV
jgi:O-antigen/teichoic acid export membrane protein